MIEGPYRCALVVRPDDGIDDGLLAEITETTGLTFDWYGTAGFGGETVADVYAADGSLLMEVVSDQVGAKALFVWAESAERAAAVRDVIGARSPAWSERMLRERLAGNFREQPAALVALVMATGGANPEPETLDLLRRALDDDSPVVRQAAEYARLVAAELAQPPVALTDEPAGETT